MQWQLIWRRMKGKAKAALREKKIDLTKTGDGEAEVNELEEEYIAILSIIAAESIFRNPVSSHKFPFTEFCEGVNSNLKNPLFGRRG
jgi:hypothetical protein